MVFTYSKMGWVIYLNVKIMTSDSLPCLVELSAWRILQCLFWISVGESSKC